MRFVFLISALVAFLASAQSQTTLKSGMAIGVKGGFSAASQYWNKQAREYRFAWHSDLFFEKFGSKPTSFYMQLGYHQRGSALVFNGPSDWTNPNSTYTQRREPTSFNTLSLCLGAKVRKQIAPSIISYGMLGLRGDLLLHQDWGVYQYYNYAQYTNSFTYGFSFGGGFEFGKPDGKLAYILDFQVQPDISRQVLVPPTYSPSNQSFNYLPQPIRELSVTNLTFEVSLGIRISKFDEDELPEED